MKLYIRCSNQYVRNHDMDANTLEHIIDRAIEYAESHGFDVDNYIGVPLGNYYGVAPKFYDDGAYIGSLYVEVNPNKITVSGLGRHRKKSFTSSDDVERYIIKMIDEL